MLFRVRMELAGADTLCLADGLFILHCLRELAADSRINPIGLGQRPLTPLFDLLNRRGSVEG